MRADDQNASGELRRTTVEQGGSRINFEPEFSSRCSLQPEQHVGNVLVVDDEGAMCEILSLYLGFKGLAVKTSQTPGEALDAFIETPFDLVILDWDLTGVESLDLLNYFKATRPETAVIIFTGKEITESFLMKRLEGRADAILPKLGSLETLWQQITSLLVKTARRRA